MENTERRPTETRAGALIASRSIRKYPVIGQVRDVDGSSWDIRDVRATQYGFDLLLGTPEPGPGAPPRNRLQLILTKELRDFWSENRTKHNGYLCDSPVANSTLNRARKRLGFKWPEDVAKFWTEHIEDLRMLRPRQFEAKYGMDRGGLLKGSKYPICGQVRDVEGALWHVRDVRTTKHGFDLYYGSPDGANGMCFSGLPRLIVTKELRDFWWANRLESHGFLFDLPAGRTTLKRARSRHQFNHRDDVREFWMERIDDLAALPAREFATKYGVDAILTFAWRFRLVGKRARPLGWWRTPETMRLLHSGMTLKLVAKELGIGTTHAGRLRRQAKKELQ